MKLLIVDGHTAFRQGLLEELRQHPDIELVGNVGSARQALLLARQSNPDVILMDCCLPDGAGVEVSHAILSEFPQINIVLLAEHEKNENLLEAVRLGIKGYLTKDIPAPKLVAALRGMLRGEAPLTREMTARLIAQVAHSDAPKPGDPGHPLHLLTTREMEVLAQLAGGLTNREIANRLVVSENTIRNHVHNILEKLNLRSRREAGALARRYGVSPAR